MQGPHSLQEDQFYRVVHSLRVRGGSSTEYLAPRFAHFILPIPGKGNSDWSYSWIPVVGPIIGGVLGAWLFNILF